MSALSRVSELVARIGELEAAVEEAAQNAGNEELVRDLEKKIESMSNDMEDTEDKYLKVRRSLWFPSSAADVESSGRSCEVRNETSI